MTRTLRIGLLGCGVVCTGVLQLLRDHRERLTSRVDVALEVRRIGVRDIARPRDAIVPTKLLTDDLTSVVEADDVDVVVEVMGGLDVAGPLMRRALERGKHVVTANKALIAEYGSDLLEVAHAHGADLYFEAAVAGGIPILRVLRESLVSDRVTRLRGVVNGTSNYILSRMAQEGVDFEVALREAQAAGYAEADPALDINGGDAAHKLAILATLAFGARVTPANVYTEGIDTVAAEDIAFARNLGYAIKPLAVARETPSGQLDLRVHPALIPRDNALANIHDAINAVQIDAAALGSGLLSGPGAGQLPTAMSVLSDIVDVARNYAAGAHGRVPPRAVREVRLADIPVHDILELRARYYLRFSVADRPGVLGFLATVLGAHDVSIEQMFQEGRSDEMRWATVVILTHRARERDIRDAIAEIERDEYVYRPAHRILIEE